MEIQQDLILSKRIWRPNFLFYRQLLENILITINDHTAAQSAMLDQCRHYYSLDETYLIHINKFAKTYQSRQAARWYTKDSFIHRFINKVLRTGNIEHCSLSRFYISHLSEQLYQLKCQQQKNIEEREKNIILYRGLRQSEAHLKTLENLVGEVILTKGFMSTSRSKHIALCYAGVSHSQSLQSQPLLIEINVDMTAPDIIAVDIAHLSNFPEEREVLFDIGVQFRVQSLQYDSSNSIWHCRLEAISNESQVIYLSRPISSQENCVDLSAYSKEEAKLERMMREERRRNFNSIYNDEESDLLWCNSPSVSWIANSPSDRARILQQKALIHWQRNGDLHRFRSDCEHAWKLFKQGINDIESIGNHDTACFLNNFGYTCQQLNDTTYAIHLLKQSFEIRNRLGASAHFRAQSLRNLGLAYINQGDYKNALASLNQALIIGQQAPPTAQWSTSITLRNFGYFFHARRDYLRATEYFIKTLETFQQCANLCIECHTVLPEYSN
jgi:tetratricopeptide (TPR) repeat protein